MNLKTYIDDLARRAQLAADIKSSPDYLWQVATGRRQASTKLALAIESNTAPKVEKHTLRPDVWPAPTKRARAA